MGSQSTAHYSSIASIDTIRLTAELSPQMLDAMRTCGFIPPLHLHLKQFELTWSRERYGRFYFSVELSLPKYAFGANVFTLETDKAIDDALCNLSCDVSTLVGFDFDAHKTNLTRVDYSANFHRGDNCEVHEILRLVRDARISRMIPHTHEGTVYFSSKSKNQQICLYSKQDKVLAELKENEATVEHLLIACGVLRIERRYKDGRACRNFQRRLRLSDRKAETLLKIDIATQALDETVSALSLDKPVVSGDLRRAQLRKYFGKGSTYLKLLGFLTDCDAEGIERIKESMPPSTFYKMLKGLRDAGVSIISSERRILAPVQLCPRPQKARVIPIRALNH